MAKFKPQYRRLLFVDKKIRQGHYPNCSTLAAEWEVTAKTIQRDISYLKWELEAPIDYDPIRRGYYYTEANYTMPAISISESDLFAVCIAEKALEQYKQTPIYAKLTSVFEKIQESLPDHVSIHPSWVESRISFFAEPATKINPRIWETITLAVRDNRTVRIRHHSPGEVRDGNERDIDPYHLVSYRGQWYVIANCHCSGEIRTFAMSRINKARLLEHRFEFPYNFDIKTLAGSHFGIMWGEKNYKTRIRFARAVAPYIIEREWHPTQKIRCNKDGSVVLSFTTNHLNEVKDWVLSWGPGAKVLGPKELIRKVRSAVCAAAALYQ